MNFTCWCGAGLDLAQVYCLECGERVGRSVLDRIPPPAPVVARRNPPLSTQSALASCLITFGVLVAAASGAATSDSRGSGPPARIVVQAPVPVIAATPALAPVPAPSTQPARVDEDVVAPEPVEPEEPAAAPVSAPVSAPEPTPTAEPLPARPDLPSFKHVFLVVLGARDFERSYGADSDVPYLAGDLSASGTLLSGYRPVAQGALANAIALVSGQGPNRDTQRGCASHDEVEPGEVAGDGQVKARSGCIYPPEAQTLFSQLTGAGLTWKVYAGDQELAEPVSCRFPEAGKGDPWTQPRPGDAYITARNPAVYFRGIRDSPDCAANVVGLDQLERDLASEDQLPAFAYITPNACDAGSVATCPDNRPAGPAATDAWLRTWIPRIHANRGYQDSGLIVIAADESAGGEGRTGALLLSPLVKPGAVVTRRYDHYALLRSLADIFRVDRIGHAADDDVHGFGASLFTTEPGER